jgi:hypothetical protein
MQIDIALESEESPNPEEALGHILISGDEGAEIRSRDIWVDDWLMALVEGVQALSRGEREFSSDIVTESHPLVLRSSGRVFSLSVAGATVRGYDLGKFQLHLKEVVSRVLDEFGESPGFRPDSFWAQLERYAKE